MSYSLTESTKQKMKNTHNQEGITHNLALMIIGLLVLGVITFAGIRVYKQSGGINALAEVKGSSNPYFSQCKPVVSERPILKKGDKDTKIGDNGKCVRAVQRALNDIIGLGIKEDGVFTEIMSQKIADLQLFFGDTSSQGVVNKSTWELLDYYQAMAIINAGRKYKDPQTVWNKAHGIAGDTSTVNEPTTSPTSNSGLGIVQRGGKAQLLVAENFRDNQLGRRGWTFNISGCKSVNDNGLKRTALECAFRKDNDAPLGNVNSTQFNIPGGAEEFTLKYKVKVLGDVTLGDQTLHSLYAMSSKGGGGQPANSYNTLYFDPYRGADTSRGGEWLLVFQDNQAINCDLVKTTKTDNGETTVIKQDLVSVTENRSVGGLQQQTQKDASIQPWSWGNPCEGGLATYTGQSGWTFNRNGAKKNVAKDEWVEMMYYVKYNTPGKFDGKVSLAVRKISEDGWTITHESNSVMFRAAGANKDAEVDKIVFGPWASSNKYNFSVRWADMVLYRGDAR